MAVTPRTAGGGSTLARDWWIDVNIASYVQPNWLPISQWQEFKPNFTPTKQDVSDFDSEGYKDEEVTALEWGCEGKVGRKSLSADGTAYDPGQEVLRLAAFQLGNGNRVDIRFYEMPGGVGGRGTNPRVEAFRGFANVTWSPDGGGQDATQGVSVTLGGKGKRNSIPHPDDGQLSAPVIQSLSPATAAVNGGTLVTITGTNFAAVTAVTVDGIAVPVADWAIVGANKVVLKAPAKAAGPRTVTVTNPGGTSASATLTYA